MKIEKVEKFVANLREKTKYIIYIKNLMNNAIFRKTMENVR